MKSFYEWQKEFKEDSMSRMASSSNGNHGTYKTKMFSRYPYKPSEEKALKLIENGRRDIQDLIVVFEGLAGFHNNDNIIKAFDDFLVNLRENGIVF